MSERCANDIWGYCTGTPDWEVEPQQVGNYLQGGVCKLDKNSCGKFAKQPNIDTSQLTRKSYKKVVVKKTDEKAKKTKDKPVQGNLFDLQASTGLMHTEASNNVVRNGAESGVLAPRRNKMKALNKCYYCKKELHAGQATKVGRKEKHLACYECYTKVMRW